MRIPCELQAGVLRDAIEAWVKASEETRSYVVRLPADPGQTLEPLHPTFFQEMQAAFERERRAREAYIEANNSLYECMGKNGLID